LNLHYEKEDFRVVEEPFEPLDIEGDSEIYGFTLRHPFYRTLDQEFAVALTGEIVSSETSLLGRPFSFNPGAQNGESDITALRFGLEWVRRSQTQVFAARSRFSVGIDALGATVNDDPSVPDGQFFAWLGQFQWARRWGVWGIETLFRTTLQLANDPLFPLEQIEVGGRYTVRGYRENQLVRDNAFLASLETRIPVIRDKPWADFVQIVPFVDFGQAWNTKTPTPDPQNLASIGLGLRWAVTLTSPFSLRPEFELYWGYPLVDVETVGGDLQDSGIHLQFVVALF
ncbi:MAG: ShlB/FhaC/HecB family hemolysin secretion/activation protein, partial [Acidimicrobiia bacterium]